jgi:Zn ribbon nucleic-acid-binding protein
MGRLYCPECKETTILTDDASNRAESQPCVRCAYAQREREKIAQAVVKLLSSSGLVLANRMCSTCALWVPEPGRKVGVCQHLGHETEPTFGCAKWKELK